MKFRYITLSLLFALLVSGYAVSAEPDLLENFRWEERIILVTADEANGRAAVVELEGAAMAINERDIYWFVFHGGSTKTNFKGDLPKGFSKKVMQTYFAEAEGTEVCLIGKDGGLKAREGSLNLEKLFALIDSMPMRQAEIRDE